MDKVFLKEIESDLKLINDKWMKIHYISSIGLGLMNIILECVISGNLYSAGFINMPVEEYLIKFMLIPNILNAFFIIVESFILNSRKMSQNIKMYTVSLIFVLICLNISTVHSAYKSLHFLLAIPILLTTIYGNYILSTTTTIIALLSLVLSELLINWDINKRDVWHDSLSLWDFLIAITVLLFFFVVCIVIIYFEKEKNKATISKELERRNLRRKIRKDELTQLYNRVALRESIDRMEMDISNSQYIFVMIDIDNFKQMNDTMGHIAGDECLIQLSGIIRKNCNSASPFRYGGDEFSILFRNTPEDEVIRICKRIKNEFNAFNYGTGMVTLSFGISTYNRNFPPSSLIINSDKALYESKKGKNMISVFAEV